MTSAPEPTDAEEAVDADVEDTTAEDVADATSRNADESDAADGPDAPDAESPYEKVERFDVFVQWKRGQPHEYAETVTAPDEEIALVFAKRNVDVRQEPVSIWIAPQSQITKTSPDDTTLVPSTDRGYRNIGWYAEHRIEPTGRADDERPEAGEAGAEADSTTEAEAEASADADRGKAEERAESDAIRRAEYTESPISGAEEN